MGERVNSILESAKNVLMIDQISEKLLGLQAYIPDFILNFIAQYKVLCYIVAIALLVLLAFEGYRLFKMALYVVSAIGFGVVGYAFIGPFIVKYTQASTLEIVSTQVLVGLVCALLAIFLTRCAYNFMILMLGCGCGFAFGYFFVSLVLAKFFNTLEFLQTDIVKIIIGVLFAAISGLLFILMFRHVFIIGSGFGCSVLAAILLRQILVPECDSNVKICFIVLGAALSIFAIVYQYKEEEKALEIVF